MISLLKQKLLDHLEDQNISISELERRAGLKRNAVGNILTGASKNPRRTTLKSLSHILGCSIEELWPSTDNLIQASKLKLPEKTLSAEWDYVLFKDVSQTIDNLLKEKNVSFNIEKIIYFIKELYLYSIRNSNRKADLAFAEWIIDNHTR